MKKGFILSIIIGISFFMVSCQTTNSLNLKKGLADTVKIPARPEGAVNGSKFVKITENLATAEREKLIYKEVSSGNIPAYLRNFKRIDVTMTDSEGNKHTGSYMVMPDYVSVGTDQDSFRAPMTPMTAQKLADDFGCILPTRKMVDDIYEQAVIKVGPKPLTKMREAVSSFYQSHNIIEEQKRGHPAEALTAGIKKDVVITNLLIAKPDRVAIYGWHWLTGKAIQPLSTVHSRTYVDYSHGIRLVAGKMTVDGKTMMVADVLTDPLLHSLVSDEGILETTRYAIE
jgi:hypothetical protein